MDHWWLAARAWNLQQGLPAHFIQHVWDVFNNTYRGKWKSYSGRICIVPKFTRHQYLKFVNAGNLKVVVYSAPFEDYDLPHQHIFVAAQKFAAPRKILMCATVRHTKCPCLHCFRWKICWAFALNCDSINKKRAQTFFIGNFYFKVIITVVIKHFQTNLKILISGNTLIWTFLCCFICGWSKHFTYSLHMCVCLSV
jgi:hypothetical protein